MENTVEEKQPKFAMAVLCSFLMGLAGSALYILFYYLGVIPWVMGLVIILAASWGYKKFNLKLDTKGYIIVSVIAIVDILIGLMIGLCIDVAVILEVPFSQSLGYLVELSESHPDLKSAIISDMILSLVCVAVGIIIFVVSEKRNEKEQKRRLEAEEKAKAEAAISDGSSSSDEVNNNNVEIEGHDDVSTGESDESNDDEDELEEVDEDDDGESENTFERE